MASARADPMFATMSSSPWAAFPVASASASSSSVYVLFWCEFQGWHRRAGTCRCTWSETKCIDNCAHMGPTAPALSTHVSCESKRHTRPYLGQSLSVKDVRRRTNHLRRYTAPWRIAEPGDPPSPQKTDDARMIQHNPFEDRGGLSQIIFVRMHRRPRIRPP